MFPRQHKQRSLALAWENFLRLLFLRKQFVESNATSWGKNEMKFVDITSGCSFALESQLELHPKLLLQAPPESEAQKTANNYLHHYYSLERVRAEAKLCCNIFSGKILAADTRDGTREEASALIPLAQLTSWLFIIISSSAVELAPLSMFCE
jgi:hypothetical protein